MAISHALEQIMIKQTLAAAYVERSRIELEAERLQKQIKLAKAELKVVRLNARALRVRERQAAAHAEVFRLERKCEDAA